ncbi:hypothetical protein M011DRAFT_474899 [Sporormia fimetaria CBS 119925]|uniref:DUF323 domain-containing protein n=1 Tax=Sporormia fimetaria CBS 119925 TaxID=1340428 RepID=A0A6A6VIP2_9PLEO|nr:hypothetical protein M011DRAFT_474899 [Sporormia fimetaria CBS 119925]
MESMAPQNVGIIDIRSGPAEFDILQDISRGLRPKGGGEKRLPTLLLYDEAGLRLFEKITYLDEYYLTNAEIEVLETNADRIAERIVPGSVTVELGSGNLRKVNILLQALDRAGKEVTYYAVDLSLPELKRTFAEIPTAGYRHVRCYGLHGTYDHALEWLRSEDIRGKPKTILWLGSSLGNFKREEAAPFLAGFKEALQPGDTMLIGIDSCKDPNRVYHAYNDSEGITHKFILNGLKHANRLLEQGAGFNVEDWQVIGEYDKASGRHHAFVSPLKDVIVDGVQISQGERIRIEESYKYSKEEIVQLWEGAGLSANCIWANTQGDYGLHMVSKPCFFFPSRSDKYAARPAPSLQDWEGMWAAWDLVSRGMVPSEELLAKPINLRNAIIFYLGHIPTFLDIHLVRATDGQPTEPGYFWTIFERGVDPDVDNPEKCHAHSEIPDSWPHLEEILKFQTKLRNKVTKLYADGAVDKSPRLKKAMWIGFEHEAMHLETLLYMLIQSEKILPPLGTVTPDFEALSRLSKAHAVQNEWFDIPETDVTLGMEDPDDPSGPERYFGWDVEKPQRRCHVQSFKARGRPITNGEYAEYLDKTGRDSIPASWCTKPYRVGSEQKVRRDSAMNADGTQNGSGGGLIDRTYVRTVYGSVPLKLALDWPVSASYDELASCAQWMGGRIPTMEEVRSIYLHAHRLKSRDVENALGKTIPAVNGHLSNEGVQETPPSQRSMNGGSDAVSSPRSSDLFIDLQGVNVGFRHWHPTSVTDKGNKLCGHADMGGVWEWTSTVLEAHEGYEPMSLYPGYSSDFFDGKHNVVLGGSWATHPRIAGRTSFVNWYQHNYPYVWAGARIVVDN